MKESLQEFAKLVGENKIEIYNEASLKFELGIFLRNAHKNLKIHFERNIADPDLIGHKNNFAKSVIDLTLFSSGNDRLDCAIELKFPTNGQYPEQMYSFCEDIRLLEQLKGAGFRRAYFFAMARDHLFWEGRLQDGIYRYFRGNSLLGGSITKPTGNSSEPIPLAGSYKFGWRVSANLRYAIVEI